MTELTEAMDTYRLFPAFAEWAGAGATSLPVVDRFLDLLSEARQRHAEPDVERAIRELSRAAAVDTNAIEGLFETDRGFTRTVATEAAAWQAAAVERGQHVLAIIESTIEAYDFVLDAATESRPITEAWIRELHEVLCREQHTYQVHTAAGVREQPMPKGRYKDLPNNPTSLTTGRVHQYASPADTPGEMRRLVEELRSADFMAAHPVLQAAWAHYAFVCIHPFADGNGRVARALASVFTYRRPGVPLVVYADQRDTYIDGLEFADNGDPDLFIDFMAQRVIDVIELVRISASLPSTPEIGDSLARIQAGNVGLQGLPHQTVDGLAQRLVALLSTEMSRAVNGLALPAGVTILTGVEPAYNVDHPKGYRGFPEQKHAVMRVVQQPPADVITDWTCTTHVALPGSERADLLITSNFGNLDVYVRDVHPAETQLLRLKLQSYVAGHTDRLFAELAERSAASLRRKGYLA